AYDAADGNQRWFKEKVDYGLTVVDGVVYTICVGSVQEVYFRQCALNARDGTVLWQAAQPSNLERVDAVVDDIVYAVLPVHPQTGIFGVAAFNAKTGHPLWSYQPDDSTVGFLQASNGQAYMGVASPNGGGQWYLSVLNTSDGSVSWRYPQ